MPGPPTGAKGSYVGYVCVATSVGLLVLQELIKIARKRQTVRRNLGDNMDKILPKPGDEDEYEKHYDFVIRWFNP